MYGRTRVKTLLSILLTFILVSYSHVVMAGTLVVNNSQISPNEAISITTNEVSGDRDWVGIYRKGDSNDWGNVLSWDWVGNGTSSLDGVPDAGNYEARLFFHNSFNLEASTAVNIASITASKANFNSGEAIKLTLAGLSGERDWVGIYRKDDSNDWGNVLSWDWANNSALTLQGIADSGEYEARLFYHNSYILQTSVAFDISSTSITTSKPSYSSNESIHVTLAGLSGDRDWVGIYRKEDSNDWGNVLSWDWAKSDTLTLGGVLDTGKYEARLFFHNSYNTEAIVGFNVGDYDYGSPGKYINDIEIDNSDEDFIVYKPKNHINNAPVMLFFGMSFATGNHNNGDKTSLRHEGLMKYLASLGSYVIGNKKVTESWTDAKGWLNYTSALEKAGNLGADTSKLGIIGHSAGGMASYYWMKKYKEQGYGQAKSFIIDLHGYHAAGMTRNDLNTLTNIDSLIIAYGGDDGNANETKHAGSDFSQDPRVLLTLSKLLPNTVKKGFIVLDTKDHMYSYGEWDEKTINGDKYDAVKDKKDLLEPIDAMIKYQWFNEGGIYNDAEKILFSKYTATIEKVDAATQTFIRNNGNYRFKCGTNWAGINYCEDYK